MLNSEASEGCSGWGISEVIGVVMSSLSVHAWSLVAMVKSVMIATIVVVVSVAAASVVHPFPGMHSSHEAVWEVVR